MANNSNAGNENGYSAAEAASRPRRGSFTSQTFNNIFGARSNSTPGGPTAPFPGPIATAAVQDQRRRMSITTLGLSGTSPTQSQPFSFGGRRGSVSTAGSDSIDENAIDDDDGPSSRSQPTTPFVRRMSFGAQALRSVQRSNGSPGTTSGRSPSYSTPLPSIPAGSRSPPSDSGSGSQGGGGKVTTPPNAAQNKGNQASKQSKSRTVSDFPSSLPGESNGFNWNEHVRSRAESSVSQTQRPSFSTSPTTQKTMTMHDRNKSIGEMSAPPSQVPAPAPVRPVRKQPDAFQERILKGDFYMD